MIFHRETDVAAPDGRWEKLWIEDAQPRETMVNELMADVAAGASPWATLTGEPFCWPAGSGRPALTGSLLTIWDDYGHRYIYKVTGYDWQADVFELEWPD